MHHFIAFLIIWINLPGKNNLQLQLYQRLLTYLMHRVTPTKFKATPIFKLA